jgi:DNA-binding GntR family transcriptional regulator
MSGDRVISRSVLADQVQDRLLQEILAGRYPPDSRIVETHVAREFGTSQTPVREALRGLEALGVVESLPFHGARVRRPTVEELLEAYGVRDNLEAFGARLGVPRITDTDLTELESLYDEMRTSADEGDVHRVAVADAAFHARLLQVAHNATLERVWRSLEPFSRTYMTLVGPGADPLWTVSLHTGIVAALRTRDPEAVVIALGRHFEEAGAHVAEGWRLPVVTTSPE